jgi:hypothetical protein
MKKIKRKANDSAGLREALRAREEERPASAARELCKKGEEEGGGGEGKFFLL